MCKKEMLEQLKECVLDVKNKDVNCYLLRFTSLYMDGSYTDYEHYQLNIRKYNKCKTDNTRLKFCYSCLVHMCKIEFGSFVNNNLITTMLEGNLTPEELDWFNSELLERAYETLSHEVM